MDAVMDAIIEDVGLINETTSEADWAYFDIGCLGWSLSINHVYFQLANSFFLLSYLAPPGLFGLIYLRLMLAIGSAFLAFWALVFVCAFDTFLWNAIFFFINSVHLTILLFSLRPIKLDPQIQQV